MAKKSNKTEHVLKLITKNDEEDNFFGIEQVSGNHVTAAFNAVPDQKSEESSEDIEVQVKPPEEKEIKYETKLKIEIQPEIEFKQKTTGAAESKISLNDLPQSKEGSAVIAQHDHLVNIAEILAKEKISLVMERMKVCTCQICVNDVLALALNSLPTKYVTTDAGKQYFQLDIYKNQYETDILAALTKACVRVKASPRH